MKNNWIWKKGKSYRCVLVCKYFSIFTFIYWSLSELFISLDGEGPTPLVLRDCPKHCTLEVTPGSTFRTFKLQLGPLHTKHVRNLFGVCFVLVHSLQCSGVSLLSGITPGGTSDHMECWGSNSSQLFQASFLLLLYWSGLDPLKSFELLFSPYIWNVTTIRN